MKNMRSLIWAALALAISPSASAENFGDIVARCMSKESKKKGYNESMALEKCERQAQVQRDAELGSGQQAEPKRGSSSIYLPFTLDVAGFASGKCEVTELARSFKEARGWASESSGWINVHSIVESPEKISISYYDGLVKAEAVRTFYRDMQTCKSFRK